MGSSFIQVCPSCLITTQIHKAKEKDCKVSALPNFLSGKKNDSPGGGKANTKDLSGESLCFSKIYSEISLWCYL